MSKQKKVRDYVGHMHIYIIISAIMILCAIAGSLIFGVEVAIEFKGGTILNYSYTGDVDTAQVETLAKGILNTPVTIQTGEVLGDGSGKTMTISFSCAEGSFTPEVQGQLTTSIQGKFPDNQIKLLESNDVSPTSGKQFFYKCLVAALAASVILIIYIALRFKRISGWSAGMCAILALVHDLIAAYGTFVIAGFEINSNFMAVLLTILGYSVNNTMVIYDRIRENQKLMDKKTSIRELVNTSISQTMRRSIRTSVTTISTMLIISIVAVIMQVDSILSFSIPLTVGLISGTYSSICIAPVVWVWWTEKRGKKTVADLQIRK